MNELIQAAAQNVGRQKFTPSFLRTEWDQVVDAWQLGTWEAYRDVQRLGRRTRLPETMRAVLWKMFEQVREELKARGLMTESSVFQALAEAQTQRSAPAYDAAVVGEAQDIGIAQLRFLAVLDGGRPNALFFTGDLGQRIFQQPFFLEGARRRRPRTIEDAARELPDVAPDPQTGRSPARGSEFLADLELRTQNS